MLKLVLILAFSVIAIVATCDNEDSRFCFDSCKDNDKPVKAIRACCESCFNFASECNATKENIDKCVGRPKFPDEGGWIVIGSILGVVVCLFAILACVINDCHLPRCCNKDAHLPSYWIERNTNVTECSEHNPDKDEPMMEPTLASFTHILDATTICSICHYNLIQCNQKPIKTLPCNHHFHQKCVEEWFERSDRYRCPLCNHEFTRSQVYL